MKAFGIRPNRELGQNFLIDSNLLDVIARAAELGPDGRRARGRRRPRRALRAPRRARRARPRRRARPPARGGAARRPRPAPERHACTSPTRSSSTSRALDPAPTKVVANLPYGVAATVILRTIEALPGVDDLGGDGAEARSASASPPRPGSAAYGVPSVLAQLACEVRVLRPVSRTVFSPGAERRLRARRPAAAPAPPPDPALRALVQQGFAHRRKALRALAWRWRGGDRDARARRARGDRACPPTRAPRRSRRSEWRDAARGEARMSAPLPARPARSTSASSSARRARTACTRSSPSCRRVSLADELTLEPARGAAGRRGRLPRRRGRRTSPARALAAFREATGLGRAAAAADDREARARRRRHGRRLRRRRGGAAARRPRRRPSPTRPAAAARRALGADVASQLRPGRVLMTGAGEHVERAAGAGAARRRWCCPSTPRSRRPPSTARPTGSALHAQRTRSWPQLDARVRGGAWPPAQRPPGRRALAVPADRRARSPPRPPRAPTTCSCPAPARPSSACSDDARSGRAAAAGGWPAGSRPSPSGEAWAAVRAG